ncbi:MAG: hypothetical protein A2V85_13030 [Chloroflexi bacterium RBG_16_72_14]|nr:MAG: hypothetical protein A2V85_13030 [Chloroflexi bacterium RBG_16_72_14]
MPRRIPSRVARAAIGVLAAAFVLLGALPVPVAAADAGLTIEAHALLQGHVRSGSWFAVAVDLSNSGPTVTGELRIAGGIDSRTRFGTPVELATGSRKQYLLYALPPTFGGNMTVELVSGDRQVAKATVAIALHDQTQLVVGVMAENPGRIVGELDLLPSQNGAQPTIVPLTPADLPERLQAWSALDRIVWQDEDASALTPGQLDALRGWIAGGGRLVIVGGTSGADALNAFPDELLPFRPTAVLDIDPSAVRPVLGGLPEGAAALTALSGELSRGRELASSGDRVIAADMAFGAGSVTILGFDPTTSWIAEGETWDAPLWRRMLPTRSGGTVSLTDDSTIVGAVSNLPSLALPPIGGLIVLLIGYIILIGPVNYLVLRWLDRREWAWITVPALIVVFAVGAFGFGALLRGSDVIVHEVAIVRGAPGTDQAVAQSYLGVFSPSRATFQVRVPGNALLAAPMNGDIFGSGAASSLDVLQGDPSRIRDLSVGYGSLRTVRAEAQTTGPNVEADLRLENNRIVGTVTNRSDRTLVSPALVFGASSTNLKDIGPGATAEVSLTLTNNPLNQASLSDRVVGQISWDFNGAISSEAEQRKLVRRSILDQLTYDPMTGFQSSFASDSPVLLAWGDDPVVPMEIEGVRVRRVANILYQVPVALTVGGEVTFRTDLLRSSVVEVNANFFSKDPWTISFGTGNVRLAFRPLPFDGAFTPKQVVVAMTFGGDISIPSGNPKALAEEARCDPADEGCVTPQDGLPDIEVLDVRTGEWVQFAHMQQGAAYELADAGRWVDPASGEVQVRFVNERQEGIGFQFPISISGVIR